MCARGEQSNRTGLALWHRHAWGWRSIITLIREKLQLWGRRQGQHNLIGVSVLGCKTEAERERGREETCGVFARNPRQRYPSHTISCHQSSNFTLALHPAHRLPLPPPLVWMAQPGGKTTFNPLSAPFKPNWQMTALRLSDFGKWKVPPPPSA